LIWPALDICVTHTTQLDLDILRCAKPLLVPYEIWMLLYGVSLHETSIHIWTWFLTNVHE